MLEPGSRLVVMSPPVTIGKPAKLLSRLLEASKPMKGCSQSLARGGLRTNANSLLENLTNLIQKFYILHYKKLERPEENPCAPVLLDSEPTHAPGSRNLELEGTGSPRPNTRSQ